MRLSVLPAALLACVALASCDPTIPAAPVPTPALTSPPASSTAPATPAPLVLTPPVATTAPATPAAAACSIRSTAGNCYRAGQFCRDGDLGKTTTDADGAAITCLLESGRPHWH